MTLSTSLVAVCCSSAFRNSELDVSSSAVFCVSSCWQDLSCSLRPCTSFLSWLGVVRGFFFFFETPSRAIWVLLTPTLEDFQGLTVRRRLIKCIPVREPSLA